ncbi:isomerase [Mesorhizobium tianshanense]|uniref:PhzF family phenazine biosynthesis protein n=1 Tax=Mesorhizobium tianshanense TaxID=39844 RepID=A0A562MQT6_9HYPH|nr:PhzF family phenazine biosynthesis protein [Mesorhizobium tianshanense]TWI22292.1 PhzF family phenazine biosynthesis protein [Mesorhizobium tianshanense]GLS36972.1 isomerase [Mesorhizobium tianshanense]
MIAGKGFILPPALSEEMFDARQSDGDSPSVVVYAFADGRFAGNPAAVVLYDRYPATADCLQLAQRFGQPLTVFLRSLEETDHFEIRWFTQNVELDLCGHGTVAATYWLFRAGYGRSNRISFHSRSGLLDAWLQGEAVQVAFPMIDTVSADPMEYEAVQRCMGVPAKEIRKAYDDYVVVVGDERIVLDYEPNFQSIARIDCRGVALTALVDRDGALGEFDIVSRFFSPRIAIDEDQVCVSAHCKLYPYWSRVLDRTDLRALQASESGGVLELSSSDGRLIVGGRAKLGSANRRDDSSPEAHHELAFAWKRLKDMIPVDETVK